MTELKSNLNIWWVEQDGKRFKKTGVDLNETEE